MTSHSKEVTLETFDAEVLGASMEVPVVVDFWASWCAPCKVLKPVLEKLADEYGGKFILAKVDTDSNQELATEFGVRGIPNVKAFVGGQVVAEFNGAIPESAVRAFLEKVIPGPVEALRLKAMKAIREGDTAAGESRLREALNLDPGHVEARLDLVESLLARESYKEAGDALQPLAERERSPRAEQYARRIDLWTKGQGLPGVLELAGALERAPKDLALKTQLGERLVIERRYEEALEQLLGVVRTDRGAMREHARKTIVEVFGMIPGQPDLVDRYRRMLASALY